MESSLTAGFQWRRSGRCNGGTCVEVAPERGGILVRSSTEPEGAILEFSHNAWREWISSVKQRSSEESE